MTTPDLSPRAIINRASQNHPLGRDGKAIASYCQMTLAELCVLQDSLEAETRDREAAEFERDRLRAMIKAAVYELDEELQNM